MKIQLIVLLLIFNYLGVYASEIAEPVEPAARPLSAARSFLDSMVIRESFIVKLRGGYRRMRKSFAYCRRELAQKK